MDKGVSAMGAIRKRASGRDRIKGRRYGRSHQALRASLESVVAAGLATCARCRERIEPGTPWDLGHDDLNPALYAGPEHRVCNRGAPMRNSVSRRW